MTANAGPIAQAYFESWKARDFESFRSLLADDVTFDGPLASVTSADECVAGIKGMSEIVTDIVIHKAWADDSDAITWFDLHTSQAEPLPTANWTHVENGKITKIRVTFDPRPLTDKKG